jgi:hypothetical protein
MNLKFHNRNISKDHAKDTGMAVVLLLLLLGLLINNFIFFNLAIPILIINMIYPMIYKPVAIFWLGLSHLLGTFMSKILLTTIFFLVVTPVGLLRRLLGYDSLGLKKIKIGNKSVMKIRNITFTKNEIEKPY